MFQYFIIYKPYQVLSQFSPSVGKKTLKDYFKVATDVYPVGRLDYDSEGLLILTNDKEINNRLLNPRFQHEREYWVEVEGAIHEHAIKALRKGVPISLDGKIYQTKKTEATMFDHPPEVPGRNPPVRFRKHIPTSWIKLILTEGKNRQVRKMTAAVGFPTLRLIRYRIENVNLGKMMPGDIGEITKMQLTVS